MTLTRRVLSLFIAFVLFGTIASGIASANSIADTVIFEDNFDSYPVGVFPSSGGWNLKYSGYGASYQIVDNSQSVSSPNSLKLEGQSGWAACADCPLPETPDQVIFEVDVNVLQPGSSTGWVNSYVSLVDPNVGWGRAYGLVGFGANMLVGPNNIPYNLNQWYHVKVKIDMVDRVYDAWLDDELIGENLSLPADGTYKCVRLSADNCGHTRVLFDNVLVTKVDETSSGNLIQLTKNSGHDVNPAWSPQGEEIVFYRNGDMYKVSSDGSSESQLTNNPNIEQRCKWSPDGKKIIYDKDNTNGWYNVWIMNADGSSQTPLTSNAQSECGVWSPNGSKIVYKHADNCGLPDDVIIMNSDGSNKQTILTNQLFANLFSWSPDGSKIAISSGAGKLGIRIVNSDGTDLNEIANGNFRYQTQSWQSQVWSPDGLKIVYQSDENGNWDIYTINFDGTQKMAITQSPSSDLYPYFSPDGNKILFVSDRNGSNDLWIMNSDGSNQVQLTQDPADDTLPVWSPDGKKIAFMSNREGNYDIWVLELEDTNIPPVADAGGPYEADEGSPISFDASASSDPDGDLLAYEWDFNNDGIFDFSSSEPYATYTWADDYTGIVMLRVTDEEGFSDTATAEVTVNNVAPEVDAGSDQSMNEGSFVAFSGNFTDPGINDTHTIEWEFGDGHNASGLLTPSHTYADDGVYTVTLTVTDNDGGIGIDTLLVTVNNVNPVVELSPNLELTAGDPIPLVGTFTDVGWLDIHTAEWDFGDGTTENGSLVEEHGNPECSGTVSDMFTYFEAGTYTVNLSVMDDDGGIGQAQLTVTVNPVEAEINFDPDTLNLGSGGKWVTVYVELPEGYDVTQIDAEQVFLNGEVPAVSDPKYGFVTDESEYLVDLDEDGIPERMFKFDREEVENILEAGDEVIVTFEGKIGYENEVSSGMAAFEGADTITVIESSNIKENNGKKK